MLGIAANVRRLLTPRSTAPPGAGVSRRAATLPIHDEPSRRARAAQRPVAVTDLLADVRTRAGPLRPPAACGPPANARITGSRSLKVRSPGGYPLPKTGRFPSGWLQVQAGRRRTAARVRRTYGQAGKRRGDASQRRRRPPTDVKPALPSERDHRSMLHGQRVHVRWSLSAAPIAPPPATVIRARATQHFRAACAPRRSAARARLLRMMSASALPLGGADVSQRLAVHDAARARRSRAKRCPPPFPSYPLSWPAAASARSARCVNSAC